MNMMQAEQRCQREWDSRLPKEEPDHTDWIEAQIEDRMRRPETVEMALDWTSDTDGAAVLEYLLSRVLEMTEDTPAYERLSVMTAFSIATKSAMRAKLLPKVEAEASEVAA